MRDDAAAAAGLPEKRTIGDRYFEFGFGPDLRADRGSDQRRDHDRRVNSGEHLPSIRSLANDLRVSVITTKRAYSDLEELGWLPEIRFWSIWAVV